MIYVHIKVGHRHHKWMRLQAAPHILNWYLLSKVQEFYFKEIGKKISAIFSEKTIFHELRLYLQKL